MENEEFLGPKTGHRSGPGGPGVARMVSSGFQGSRRATRENIPTIPGLIGVTAHHLCSTTTKTSDRRPEQSCGTRHWHTGPRSQLVIVSFKGFQFNIKLLKQVFGAQF